MNELEPLISELQSLIEKASAPERRKLATQIARQLRASQAARIKANQNPDGSPYEARKEQTFLGRKRKGRIRKVMFGKLIRTRWLKGKGSASEATVSFIGSATRIANVHQYGLRDRVNKHGTEATFPQRELLGLTRDEENKIETTIVEFLANHLSI